MDRALKSDQLAATSPENCTKELRVAVYDLPFSFQRPQSVAVVRRDLALLAVVLAGLLARRRLGT